LSQLVLAGGCNVEDLAAQRQHRLRGTIPRLLGRAASRIALDDEDLGTLGGGIGAVGELTGKAQLADRAFARVLLLLAAADALLRALDHEVEEVVGLGGIAGEPMVERAPDCVLADACALGGSQPILGLTLKFRLADEYRDHACGAVHHVVARDYCRALALAHALGMVFDTFQESATQTRLVHAAVRRRNRVAIRGQEAVTISSPCDR